ncbi:flagellar filament capping protein FliD [Halomonas sp. TBZ9]|uniref:Flagellar hook-associated protein 2 n=1 Tax=Vreelandella azerica TaxID=2732867 RepID=A0A7Y3TWT3_9GAMM|nr:flagellar filament capping protein FliD [Halomonas azerica]NOG31195.1 flagellar filament capping protein FliD [Halomonas azerica]
MATITSLGIGSGLDLSGLLDQLNDAERGKLAPITRQQEQQEAKISAYGKLESALNSLNDAVDALSKPSLYESLSASVRGDEITATTDATALPGSYSITVDTLATRGTLASVGVDDAEAKISGASEQTLTFVFGEETNTDAKADTTVTIAANSSLEDIRDAINADADSGVDASVIFDGSQYRLALSSRDTGADASISGFSFSGTDPAPLVADTGSAAKLGTDASLTVNGVAITSANNQIEGAIQGVTLDLNALNIGAGETASSTVNVERNTLKIRESVGDFVEAFNGLKETIGTLTSFNGDRETAGELVGDSTVRTIEGRLRSVLGSGVAGGEFSTLSQLGITLQRDGTLEMDDDTISNLAKNQPDALGNFFAGAEGNNGLGDLLGTAIDQLTGKNGTLGIAISGAENRIESLNTRYERAELSIERTIERYRVQFGQLDSMIAQMNQTSTYLNQQFDALDAALGRKD